MSITQKIRQRTAHLPKAECKASFDGAPRDDVLAIHQQLRHLAQQRAQDKRRDSQPHRPM
jgi:predicted outer membrane protein